MAPLNVLFLCTGNNARSIFGEALMNQLPLTAGKFRGFSAGSHPKGEVHPLALDLLRSQQMSVDGLRSKSWDEFGAAGAPHMDFVITVCDQAACEVCPVWPGRPTTTHWSVPDPAGAVLAGEDRRKLFFDAFVVLRRRIELFASLPLDKLSGLPLKDRLDEIAAAGAR
jgi:protein-tyrosine-phosphatase